MTLLARVDADAMLGRVPLFAPRPDSYAPHPSSINQELADALLRTLHAGCYSTDIDLHSRLCVGVNSDPRIDVGKKSVDTHKVPFPSLWCREQGTFGALPRARNIERWPAVFALDKNGVIHARHTSGKNLDPIIEKRIEEEASSEPMPDSALGQVS